MLMLLHKSPVNEQINAVSANALTSVTLYCQRDRCKQCFLPFNELFLDRGTAISPNNIMNNWLHTDNKIDKK